MNRIDPGLADRLLEGPLAGHATDGGRPQEGPGGFSPSGALSAYFYGASRRFSGSVFDSFAGGGDRPDVQSRITHEDVLAVAAVNVTVSARLSRQLLTDPVAGRLEQLLRRLPTDVDLWDADDEMLAVARQAWEEIRTLDEDGHGTADRWVTASKLLARKRPRLVPLYDEKIRRVAALADGTDWWLSLREALRHDCEDNEVRHRVRQAMREAASPRLRVGPAQPRRHPLELRHQPSGMGRRAGLRAPLTGDGAAGVPALGAGPGHGRQDDERAPGSGPVRRRPVELEQPCRRLALLEHERRQPLVRAGAGVVAQEHCQHPASQPRLGHRELQLHLRRPVLRRSVLRRGVLRRAIRRR